MDKAVQVQAGCFDLGLSFACINTEAMRHVKCHKEGSREMIAK